MRLDGVTQLYGLGKGLHAPMVTQKKEGIGLQENQSAHSLAEICCGTHCDRTTEGVADNSDVFKSGWHDRLDQGRLVSQSLLSRTRPFRRSTVTVQIYRFDVEFPGEKLSKLTPLPCA